MPQVLMLHVVVVEDVERRHLFHLGVVALALPLSDVDIAFLALVKEGLGLVDDNVLAR